jgi:aldehyde dehydrogenase (NAD+)
VAVWAWNAMIAAVCGDVIIWKPSAFAPMSAIAANEIARTVARKYNFEGVFSLLIDDGDGIGKRLAADPRIPLVSATGSCAMGRSVAEVVGRRLGRSILELGGNNAVTILDDADLDLAVSGVLFGAVGTAGQRCTSVRRVLVHREIEEVFLERLKKAYSQVSIGDPLQEGVLMGPLIDQRAVDGYSRAIRDSLAQGGELLYGGNIIKNLQSSNFVEPTIIRARREMPILHEETFAPIIFVIPVDDLREAIEVNNEVPQGLSSSLFSTNMQSVERFLSSCGSDCGIANVNMGTSGAEIGGAFGGEKETGGGRESGSDAWKQYMRRQTCSINYGDAMPLAQGIKFS